MTTNPDAAKTRFNDGETWTANRLKAVADRVAADLTDLADRIRQEADQIDRPRSNGGDTYAFRAEFIHGRIMNALPNLPLGSLITLAATADSFAAEKDAKGATS